MHCCTASHLALQLQIHGEEIDMLVDTEGVEIVTDAVEPAVWDLETRTLTVDLPLVFKRSDGQSFDLA